MGYLHKFASVMLRKGGPDGIVAGMVDGEERKLPVRASNRDRKTLRPDTVFDGFLLEGPYRF